MESTMEFPSDENGDVLRRMQSSGDDLAQPRMIDFCFIFEDRAAAIKFTTALDDRELEVCIAYNQRRSFWDVIVKRYMVPTHQGISNLEASLTEIAYSTGGKPDGWGCLQVGRKSN